MRLLNNRGFTLIEVLVALAIVSIALTAIIKTTTHCIRDTIYLQNKTIASFVATHVMNQARVGLIKLPEHEPYEYKTEMLNQTWDWQAEWVASPNPLIKQINVRVYDEKKETLYLTYTSYLYVPKPQE